MRKVDVRYASVLDQLPALHRHLARCLHVLNPHVGRISGPSDIQDDHRWRRRQIAERRERRGPLIAGDAAHAVERRDQAERDRMGRSNLQRGRQGVPHERAGHDARGGPDRRIALGGDIDLQGVRAERNGREAGDPVHVGRQLAHHAAGPRHLHGRPHRVKAVTQDGDIERPPPLVNLRIVADGERAGNQLDDAVVGGERALADRDIQGGAGEWNDGVDRLPGRVGRPHAVVARVAAGDDNSRGERHVAVFIDAHDKPRGDGTGRGGMVDRQGGNGEVDPAIVGNHPGG